MTPALATIHAGSTIGGECRPSRRHKGKRVCAHEGCTTILSVYNHDRYCAVHEAAADDIDALERRRPSKVQRASWGSLRVGSQVKAALEAAAPGKWVHCPPGINRSSWKEAVRRLRASGVHIESRRGSQGGGWRLADRVPVDLVPADITGLALRVYELLRGGQVAYKPADMSRKQWSGAIEQLRKKGYKVASLGAETYQMKESA